MCTFFLKTVLLYVKCTDDNKTVAEHERESVVAALADAAEETEDVAEKSPSEQEEGKDFGKCEDVQDEGHKESSGSGSDTSPDAEVVPSDNTSSTKSSSRSLQLSASPSDGSRPDSDWSITFEQFLASLLTEEPLCDFFERQTDVISAIVSLREKRLERKISGSTITPTTASSI